MLTEYHAKYFAYELTKRNVSDSVQKLAASLADAQVDLNPHQVEAALFAFRAPLSKGAILAKVSDSDIVLDFFSGSCSTAHAVLAMNQQTDGSRKFIMVQLPEPCDETSEAFKSGYKIIADKDERMPDLRRCERIRWPKPIIEHCEECWIKVWENERFTKKGKQISVCIWFEQVEYFIILRKRAGYILFWTGYPVTALHRKEKLEKEYLAYKNKQGTF